MLTIVADLYLLCRGLKVARASDAESVWFRYAFTPAGDTYGTVSWWKVAE